MSLVRGLICELCLTVTCFPRISNADFCNDRDELIETVERVVEELPDDST